MDHLGGPAGVVTLVLSGNKLHLAPLRHIGAVSTGDEHVMSLAFRGTPPAHAQELGIARVLTPDPLHQRGQQSVERIDRFIPVSDLV